MQRTSNLYQDLLAHEHTVETRLAIGEPGVLITKLGNAITFGGVRILVGKSGADTGYAESMLMSVEISGNVFNKKTPVVGGCISSEIDVLMRNPTGQIPRQARMVPYVRLTDGSRYSEWVQKGVYYIDTREVAKDLSGLERLHIHGYDSMLKTEDDYPSSNLDWPARDIDVVKEIADHIDVDVHADTIALINKGYKVQYPGEYSCREVLGFIASMYAGNFVMSYSGELRLITLNGIPKETRYLISEMNRPITFGGVRILV